MSDSVRPHRRQPTRLPHPWDSPGKITGVGCHFLLQCTTFCHTFPPWPPHLGWPHRAWLSFIELDKAVVRMIRLTSFLWLWCQYVCPLIPFCNTYHLTWVSFYLGHGVSLHGCSRKVQLLLTLDEGYLLTATPSDLGRGVAPLGPPASRQPLFLGRGVALLSCCPGLGHGVAPLGHHPWPQMWSSSSQPQPWPWVRGSSSWPCFCVVRHSWRTSGMGEFNSDDHYISTTVGRNPLEEMK